MWTSGNGMISNLADLLTKRTNKEMCMRYTQMVEEMLWMIDVRRVDLNTGASDKNRERRVGINSKCFEKAGVPI